LTGTSLIIAYDTADNTSLIISTWDTTTNGYLYCFPKNAATGALTVTSLIATEAVGANGYMDNNITADNLVIYNTFSPSSGANAALNTYTRNASTGVMSVGAAFTITGATPTIPTPSVDGLTISWYVTISSVGYLYTYKRSTGSTTFATDTNFTLGIANTYELFYGENASGSMFYILPSNIGAGSTGELRTYSRNLSTGAVTASQTFTGLVGEYLQSYLAPDGASFYIGGDAVGATVYLYTYTSTAALVGLTASTTFSAAYSGQSGGSGSMFLSPDGNTFYWQMSGTTSGVTDTLCRSFTRA